MESRINVSSRFDRVRSRHELRLLITLSGHAPVARPPINLALVLDRSGSMRGAPLRAAKDSARHFASLLTPQDRVSIVAFDTTPRLIAGPLPGGHPETLHAIEQLESGSATNLSGGWQLGEQIVRHGLVQGTNRVVLFTDGAANRGIVDVSALVSMAHNSASAGVSTSCIGFGAYFNEDLLEAMARAGRGNYWYIENASQMLDIFASEIENLVAYAARDVTADIVPTHPADTDIQLFGDYATAALPGGALRVQVGSFYANTPAQVGVTLRIAGHDSATPSEVARVHVSADEVTAEGTRRYSETLAVRALLNRVGERDDFVEMALLRLMLAKCRDEAVTHLDRGDYESAITVLGEGVEECGEYTGHPEMKEELSGIHAQIWRLQDRQFTRSDRKYQKAYAMAVRQSKSEYIDMLRRDRGE